MGAGTEVLSERAQRMLESDAYEDYIACEINGMSRKERADERGITPSTVSAGIKRVEEAIKDGIIEAPGAGATVSGGRVRLDKDGHLALNERKDIAEGIMLGASMFIEQTAKLDEEHARLERRMADMQDSLATVTERRDAYRELGVKAGFDWDAYEAAVASVESGETPEAEGETATTEATA